MKLDFSNKFVTDIDLSLVCWHDRFHPDWEINDMLKEFFSEDEFFQAEICDAYYNEEKGNILIDIGICLFDNNDEEYTLWIPINICTIESKLGVGDMVVVKSFPAFGIPPKPIKMKNARFSSKMFTMCGHVAVIKKVVFGKVFELEFEEFPDQRYLWTDEMIEPYTPYKISYDECACMI